FVLALTATLAGCAATQVLENSTTPLADALPEPNYHRIVGENLNKICPKQPEGEPEISGLRPVQTLKGPAWLTCLRIDPGGNPQQYAIFIQDNAVVDWRVAVVVDQCHKEAYSPLPPPEPDKPPAPTRN